MKKVIIADGHREIRKRLVEMVLSSGIRVDKVENGLELVEKVKLEGYDLIFTDNRMPIINGLDAIKKIRSFNKEVPIYLLLDYLLSDDEKIGELLGKKALEYGANGFLYKLDENLPEKIEEIKKTHLRE